MIWRACFAFDKISTAPARFDPDELRGLNAKLLHTMPYDRVAARLEQRGIDGGAGVLVGRARQSQRSRRRQSAGGAIVSGATQPLIEDRELTDKAAALLPEEPWDDTTWDTWIAALKTASGRKGRALFHPLRLALTGREDGPELKLLLPLIGRDRTRGAPARPHGLTVGRQCMMSGRAPCSLRMKAIGISWPDGRPQPRRARLEIAQPLEEARRVERRAHLQRAVAGGSGLDLKILGEPRADAVAAEQRMHEHGDDARRRACVLHRRSRQQCRPFPTRPRRHRRDCRAAHRA